MTVSTYCFEPEVVKIIMSLPFVKVDEPASPSLISLVFPHGLDAVLKKWEVVISLKYSMLFGISLNHIFLVCMLQSLIRWMFGEFQRARSSIWQSGLS